MRVRSRVAIPLLLGALSVGFAPALVASPIAHAVPAPGDDTPTKLTPKGEREDGSREQDFEKLRNTYYSSRLLAGDTPSTRGGPPLSGSRPASRRPGSRARA